MKITQRLYEIGCILFLGYACFGVVPQFLLLAGFSIAPWHFWLSCLCWIFVSLFCQKKCLGEFGLSNFSINFMVSCLLFVGCLFFAGSVFDASFDGNWYHQDAIYLLKEGWNPAYEILAEEQTSYCSKYLNHFPKITWVNGALIFSITQNIEMAKAANLQLILSVLFVAQYFFQSVFRIGAGLAWLFACLLATNPIQILNLCNNYADGQLSSLLVIGIIFLLFNLEKGNWALNLMGLLALALAANIKFTAAIYTCIFVFGFLFYQIKFKSIQFKKSIGIGMLWGIFTFGILGWNPYMSNLIRFNHPMYPLNKGGEEVFAKNKIYPANFLELNRFERFFRSFYATPGWHRNPENSQLKTLFVPVELGSYDSCVPELAAFGPIAPEIFLVLLPFSLFAIWQLGKRQKIKVAVFLGILLVSIFINPECWVLRYVPQFWLLIVALLFLVFLNPKLKKVGVILALAFLLNNLILLHSNLRASYKLTNKFKLQVNEVLVQENDLEYYSGWTKTFKIRLENLGLNPKNEVYIAPEDTSAKAFVGGLGALYRKRNSNK